MTDEKKTRTPSPATLAKNAFGKVQTLKRKIKDEGTRFDRATEKHKAKMELLRRQLTEAAAEMEKHEL